MRVISASSIRSVSALLYDLRHFWYQYEYEINTTQSLHSSFQKSHNNVDYRDMVWLYSQENQCQILQQLTKFYRIYITKTNQLRCISTDRSVVFRFGQSYSVS